ncbi:DUF2254 family protein [Flavobacterium sp. RNTU_13]|uniref:DUF2254 family protein n=1 Tax=Flavobacterium sp. RNTU_13 TaxID=3375145 RepID=UPI0039867CD9
MSLTRLKFKFGQWLEHRIKYIGTLLSNAFALLISVLLLLTDYGIDLSKTINEAEVYSRLSGVASIMVSIVIGISLTTFSVIFVVMQLASSQFSPRILRHFLANDVRVQQYIGLFIGTVGLCVIPMAVSAFTGKPFTITITSGIVLALYCLVWSYPRMITYLSVNMNVAAIADKVKGDTVNEINALYPEDWQPGMPMLYTPLKPEPKWFTLSIKSPLKSGYLEHINYLKLEKYITALAKHYPWSKDLVLYQRPIVGEFIMQWASALITLQLPETPTREQQTTLERLMGEIIDDVFTINTFRSYTQDINFGVRKLVDIAIKAISPAVNDPTTCLNCIDQLGDIARNLQLKAYPSAEARQLQSKNIIANEFNFEQLIDFCFDQIFQWGKEDPTVVRRLIQTLRLLAENAENPYNLMVLIKQVNDMELPELYSDTSVKERNIKISKEKIEGIHTSLRHFEQAAKQRIDYLKSMERLQYKAKGLHCEIESAEEKAIAYLIKYIEKP